MEKKYILTDNRIINDLGIKMFQIKCTKAFGLIKEGELGGFIEKEANLSQDGNAWVYGDAQVYGDAWVSGNAQVYGNAWVYGDAWVSGNARVSGDAQVYGDARVSGNARVYGDADIDSNDKHCGFDCFGSENRHTHAYMTRWGEMEVTCGCFRGTFDEFVRKVEETHAGTVYEKQYKAVAKLIKIKFKLD